MFTGGFKFGEFTFTDGTGVDQEACEQRRLAVIDVACEDDVHMYPPARSRSKASSLSESITRPARSGALVARNSSMIWSIEIASLWIGSVMFFSPSDRNRFPLLLR